MKRLIVITNIKYGEEFKRGVNWEILDTVMKDSIVRQLYEGEETGNFADWQKLRAKKANRDLWPGHMIGPDDVR